MNNDNASIELMIIYPRTDKYCAYTVNDNEELHTKKLGDMVDFLSNLLQGHKLHIEIDDYIYTFRPFYVDFRDKKVVELKYSKTALKEEYYQEIRESTNLINKSTTEITRIAQNEKNNNTKKEDYSNSKNLFNKFSKNMFDF